MTNSCSEFQEIAILPGLGAALAFLIALALVAIVVFPAVWSRDAERRSATLAVLRLLLHHWSHVGGVRTGRRGRRVLAGEDATDDPLLRNAYADLSEDTAIPFAT